MQNNRVPALALSEICCASLNKDLNFSSVNTALQRVVGPGIDLRSTFGCPKCETGLFWYLTGTPNA